MRQIDLVAGQEPQQKEGRREDSERTVYLASDESQMLKVRLSV
jgi:hypothetical protein